jgi:hypothetical protein
MTASAIRTAGGPTGGRSNTTFLRPAAAAPFSQRSTHDLEPGLALLRERAEPQAQSLARALVEFSLAPSGIHAAKLGTRRQPVPMSVRNRRRRSAGLWINAILAGRTDQPTLEALTGVWLPQLAGTGPDRSLAVPHGVRFVEYLRGAMTAALFPEPAENLVPEAYGLQALETVLAIHLGAIRGMRRRARV